MADLSKEQAAVHNFIASDFVEKLFDCLTRIVEMFTTVIMLEFNWPHAWPVSRIIFANIIPRFALPLTMLALNVFVTQPANAGNQTNYINFDSVDAGPGVNGGNGVDATAYLASKGVTLTGVGGGESAVILNTQDVYGGVVVFPPSPPNFLFEVGNEFGESYTLNFNTPLSSLTFTRCATHGGAATPIWSATAFEGATELGSVGDPSINGFYESAAKTYTFTATPGSTGITSLTVYGNGENFAALETAPLDDFYLVSNTLTLGEAAAELALTTAGLNYLKGGKGWDYYSKSYVPARGPITLPQVPSVQWGYTYYNADLKPAGKAFGLGLDCSGLVMWSYNTAAGATRFIDDPTGVAPTHSTGPVIYQGAAGQYWENTTKIDESDLQPGDLLFFNNLDGDLKIDHVAMYIGGLGGLPGFDVIEAAYPGVGIIYASKDNLKVKTQRIKDPTTGGLLPTTLPAFAGFRRVPGATDPLPNIGQSSTVGGTLGANWTTAALQIIAHSPVDLIVTDPDGHTISPFTFIDGVEEYLTEVPGQLYYAEYALDTNGDASPIVIAPSLKTGNYLIKVAPKPHALPTDMFGLDVVAARTTIHLAQNVQIADIPQLGYGIQSSGQSITPFMPVEIEINPDREREIKQDGEIETKQDSSIATINLASHRKTSVAILSSATFDATRDLDLKTLTLAGAPVATRPNGTLMASSEDVNDDELPDLVIRVDTQAMQLSATSTEAELDGKTINGVPIKGVQSIRVVLPETGHRDRDLDAPDKRARGERANAAE